MNGVAPEEALLSQCDREPIHAPGAIQPHGALLAYLADERRVVYASANLASLLALEVDALGANIDDVLATGSRERFEYGIEPPGLDSVPVSFIVSSLTPLYASAHRSDGLVIVEFEIPAATDTNDLLIHELRSSVERIEQTTDVEEACRATVEEVRRLTGYDRAMVYRFHEDDHGEVVAEARIAATESYLGHHYPASDIPLPARRLLLLSPLRLIADVNAANVPIVGESEVAVRELDLSRAALRAVSPIHLQYLRNMGVAGSLTVSLTHGARLWGLLACHHRDPKWVPPGLRAACAILSRTLWLRMESHERREQAAVQQRRLLRYARFVATVSSVDSLADALVADGRSLLELVGADGLSIRLDGGSATLGVTPAAPLLAALVGELAELPASAAVATDEAGARFARVALEPADAAGILAVPVGGGWDEHVIWFRGETEIDLVWAGDPSKPMTSAPTGANGKPAGVLEISPRTSFTAWRELARGRAAPWTQADLGSAAELIAALPLMRAARRRDALARLAVRDSLTGLPNRTLLRDRLDVALAGRQRGQGGVWVLFIDLDGFKEVNDSLGHDAGDQVLVEVAVRLSRGVRSSDTVARLGGDEFVVVCAESASDATVQQLAARLLASVAAPITVPGASCTVTASIGISEVDDTIDAVAALGAADAAMYRAKSLGRNRASR